MAVAERYTSQVPKNQHEAPFLVVHVPVTPVSENLMSKTNASAYHVVTIDSSAFEHAFAYKKWAMMRKPTSPDT